ncbi:unnamed protein product, partial [Chrysoparadoxa australica]
MATMPEPGDMEEHTLTIVGMTCGGCVGTCTKALSAVPGVSAVKVLLESNEARLTASHDVKTQDLIEALDVVGFEASLLSQGPTTTSTIDEGKRVGAQDVTQHLIYVSSLICACCNKTVTRCLSNIPGVSRVLVTTENKQALVCCSAKVTAKDCVDALEEIGHNAKVVTEKFSGFGSSRLLLVPDEGAEGETKEEASYAQDLSRGRGRGREALARVSQPKQRSAVSLMRAASYHLSVASISIGGMTCSTCTRIIEGALINVEGVEAVAVSLALELADITYNSSLVGPQDLLSCIQSVGFTAVLYSSGDNEDEDERDLAKAQQMRDKALKKARRSLVISLVFTLPLIVLSMGYGHSDLFSFGSVSDQDTDMASGPGKLFEEVLPGLDVMTILQVLLATPVQFGPGLLFYKSAWAGIKSRILGMSFLIASGTTAAYLYSAILVVLGLASGIPQSHNLFFETSAALITFVLLGKWLELLAKGNASSAVNKLLGLQAQTAVLIQDWPKCSQEEVVETKQLRPGNVVKIIRGAKVPADGVVEQGNGTVDESMLTGESMPVSKGPGNPIIGGTVACEGLLYVRVTRCGKSTMLSEVVRLVEKAQSSKAPLQELGDRISAVFVPTVCVLSLVTFVTWVTLVFTGVVPESWYGQAAGSSSGFLFSFLFGLAVLVIACPCAVGLAAPVAVVVGLGVGANHGLLMKGGEMLQVAGQIRAILFDKTGTLTQGKPVVVTHITVMAAEDEKEQPGGPDSMGMNDDVSAAPAVSVAEAASASTSHKRGIENSCNAAMKLIAAAEANSEHPLATAIVDYVRGLSIGVSREGLPPIEQDTFQATSGRGLVCSVESHEVVVGSPLFVQEKTDEKLGEQLHKKVLDLEERGQTVVLAAVDGVLKAVFGIADAIRPEAVQVIGELEKAGIKVYMVTGDNRRTAKEVARRVGIPEDNVMAEVLPGKKAEMVVAARNDLLKNGKQPTVAFIGDGINDAPALAQASVGIAIGSGTDVAVETADIILARSSLLDLLTAIDLCKTIYNRIKLNFIWALGYNTVGIPVAAGVFFPVMKRTLPPALAGAAMALSSVSVLASSLALNLYRPPGVVRRQAKRAKRAEKAEKGATGDNELEEGTAVAGDG